MLKKYRIIYIPTGEFSNEEVRVDKRLLIYKGFLASSNVQLHILCSKACDSLNEDICFTRPCGKCCWWYRNILNNENLYAIVELEE